MDQNRVQPPWMKIPLPPGSFDIVTSSNGLVLVRLPSWADDASPGVELVVGNPATNEWVDPTPCVSDAFNYDSSSRAWTRVAEYPEGFLFDTARCIIVPHKEPLLNDPTLVCVPFVWEHICGLCHSDQRGQCRVWRMEEPMDMAGKREASCVLDVEKAWSSGHCHEVASSFLDLTDVYWDDFVALECQAEGNLLCLAGQCPDRYDDGHKLGDCGGEPLPPAVYDLDRGEWFYIRGKRETVGQYSVGALGLDPEEEKRLAHWGGAAPRNSQDPATEDQSNWLLGGGEMRDMVLPATNWEQEDKRTLPIAEDIFDVPMRKDIVQHVVKWQRAKRRKGTKTRGEVAG
ncbi:hypothetical protein SELMODRAFT_424334 [Selaginella moellendorffii]|uniref:Uncharacterized protein n=1 Tax=Selaginella moellendorffii TaxID=88036 RepID=D8SPJ7_SELML|nr:hypothetical protein SELMODRAFT_424334 [Selaginella moellendorffii]